MPVKLTILVDNTSAKSEFQAEHGLAILIQGGDLTALFDTGATQQALMGNLAQAGVAPTDVQAAILSHGHADHTGGLAALASSYRGLRLYAHATAFCRRFADRPGQSLREIGCPAGPLRLQQAGVAMQFVQSPEMLQEWLILSGPVGGPPRGDERFVIRKGEELVIDHFEDEQFVLVKGAEGWVVLSGCCHRGLRNTLRLARFLARGERIAGIVGGLHLHNADEEGLGEALDQLRQHGPLMIHPCHCTGQGAIDFLRKHLGTLVQPVGSGTTILV